MPDMLGGCGNAPVAGGARIIDGAVICDGEFPRGVPLSTVADLV
jgi:hypothetical protein